MKLLTMTVLFSTIFLISGVTSYLSSSASNTVFSFLNTLNFEFADAPAQAAATPAAGAPAAGAAAAAPKPAGNSTDSSNSSMAQNSTYSLNLADPNVRINSWGCISSAQFKNQERFPTLNGDSGKALININSEYYRLNPVSNETSSMSALQFSFTARGGYLYYATDEKDINVIGSIYVMRIANSEEFSPINSNATCVDVFDFEEGKFHVCFMTQDDKYKYLCSFQRLLNQVQHSKCYNGPAALNVFQEKTIVNPVVIIPLQSRMCNENWTYRSKGKDWECTCSEGKKQSPIDLPSIESAIDSPLRPLFQYKTIEKSVSMTTSDGLSKAGEPVKLRFLKNALRIIGADFGKVVTLDGAVYVAEEIVFHTPAEHTVNGQKMDIEIKVIHYGRTKGDIAKQLTLSFLYKKKAGVENKFLDRMNYMDLPNPVDSVREMTEDLYIPHLFYEKDDVDPVVMEPFSFYSYEGSLSAPPCTERTSVFVVSEILRISSMTIELMKEALRAPDVQDNKGNIFVDTVSIPENNREVQPLNGRSVYHFDHVAQGCPAKIKRRPTNEGHYEKIPKIINEMVFINGSKPSGVPGALVISENRARGKPETELNPINLNKKN